MNVRFDTWMKRANLCERATRVVGIPSLAEISSYSGPYGPHLLPDGSMAHSIAELLPCRQTSILFTFPRTIVLNYHSVMVVDVNSHIF